MRWDKLSRREQLTILRDQKHQELQLINDELKNCPVDENDLLFQLCVIRNGKLRYEAWSDDTLVITWTAELIDEDYIIRVGVVQHFFTQWNCNDPNLELVIITWDDDSVFQTHVTNIDRWHRNKNSK